LAENADFKRLLSLPGIGAIMALTILAEAGDLRLFHDHRQFLSYCGMIFAKRNRDKAADEKRFPSAATNVSEWSSGWPVCAQSTYARMPSVTSMSDTFPKIRSTC
jgi:hypothetical protein